MNNTTNISENASCLYVSAVFTIVMALIGITAFIGNILVIAAVYRTPSLRTSTNYYYVNMAVSDFMCSITTWPLYLTDEIITSTGSIIQGPLATIGCQIGVFGRMVSYSVSILSLVLIAVDRFIAIVFPLKAALLTRKLRAALICVTWVISLAFYFPDIIFSRVEQVGQVTSCIFTWNDWGVLLYYAISIVFFNVLPIVTIIVIYFRIMHVLRSRMKPEGLDRKFNDLAHKRTKQNQNIMKMFIAIVLVLVVCFTFFGLYVTLRIPFYEFFLKDKCKISLGFCYFVFPFLSTMINPIILYAFSTNFRHAMRKVAPLSLDKCCQMKRVAAYAVDDSHHLKSVTYKRRSGNWSTKGMVGYGKLILTLLEFKCKNNAADSCTHGQNLIYQI